MDKKDFLRLNRRELLRLGGGTVAAGVYAFRSSGLFAQGQTCPPQFIDQTPFPIEQANTGIGVNGEPFPTSPFIMNPFTDELPIPQAMLPGWRQPDGTLAPGSLDAWTVRESAEGDTKCYPRGGPTNLGGEQDAMGIRARWTVDPATGRSYAQPFAGRHQLWPGQSGTPMVGLPQPILYHIRLQVRTHSITSSAVRPIDANGLPLALPFGAMATPYNNGYRLPGNTIYGFNGTFPGPLINAEYGQPVCIRFENDLDMNPFCLDRQDFGAPDWAFLTHLHNGHTACESDGNPHHLTDNEGGYRPGEWCDNLYNMVAAGGDPNEKQSFLWFHDHRMHHTGANVYKGMVGLMPHYDPILDPGDETGIYGPVGKQRTSKTALRLPGRRVDDPITGTFNVKYDIPLALYDCRLDDGLTPHQDFHNGQGQLHPEWWGQSFFRHYPNHGFVGDIFTVNGKAYPVLHVKRRKYRLRFLDASIARIYQLSLMSSVGAPEAAPGSLGQWQLPGGQQCMKLTQIASEGGLLPRPIVRDSFELWPAKRREFIVDFTKYMDKSPTTKGDVIYLVNTLEMPTGRKPSFPFDGDFVNHNYKVPLMKIIIDGDPPEPDLSVIPTALRPMPALPSAKALAALPKRQFRLERGNLGNETEWIINGMQFDALNPLACPVNGKPELWTVQNGGGGWVHPMHMHMEEHTVLSRNGKAAPDALHPDDTGKEDVVALYPSESVTFYRNFRTFHGNYVAHCHNLAHEDHNMMFGWSIV